MLNLSKKKYYLVLMLLSLSFLSSCVQTNYEVCPVYPIAGQEVALELSNFEGVAFWEWMARINKLRQQLEICGNK